MRKKFDDPPAPGVQFFRVKKKRRLAEGQVCADPGARTFIGVSRILVGAKWVRPAEQLSFFVRTPIAVSKFFDTILLS